FAPKRHRHAEQIAWTDKADDDLLTVWGHLGDTQASMQQQEKRRRRFVWGENGRAFGVMPRMRALQNVIECLGRKSFEHRQIGNQGLVDFERQTKYHRLGEGRRVHHSGPHSGKKRRRPPVRRPALSNLQTTPSATWISLIWRDRSPCRRQDYRGR